MPRQFRYTLFKKPRCDGSHEKGERHEGSRPDMTAFAQLDSRQSADASGPDKTLVHSPPMRAPFSATERFIKKKRRRSPRGSRRRIAKNNQNTPAPMPA